jgi:hypothetical protein
LKHTCVFAFILLCIVGKFKEKYVLTIYHSLSECIECYIFKFSLMRSCYVWGNFCLFQSSDFRIMVYMVIHKSLRDFRPLRYSSRDGHAKGEHVNRGRDTPSFCPNLQGLWITLYPISLQVRRLLEMFKMSSNEEYIIRRYEEKREACMSSLLQNRQVSWNLY